MHASNSRSAAVDALVKIENGVLISAALDEALVAHKLNELDRALAAEIVYGSVRMQKTIDYVLNSISSIKINALEPLVRNILRTGAYQILYLDRVPVSAAVNEAVKLAPVKNRRKVSGYINAVLRNLVRKHRSIQFPDLDSDPVGHVAVKYSHPEWLVKRWLDRYGLENTIRFCQINNTSPELHLRVNTLRISLEKLRNSLVEQGIAAEKGRFAPDVLICSRMLSPAADASFEQGYYYIQNESSALVAHALAPRPGEIVYDLCAAPGGKATHLGQLMANQGQIIAVDQTRERIELIQENAARLGISIIKTLVGDARSLQLPTADRVLVDAPCSGLGVLRQRPDARWRRKEQDIDSLAKLQRQILENAATLVKPGGTLVYATCTTEPEENQDMIKWFLERYPHFSQSALPSWFPMSQSVGMTAILPFIHGIDGFFICKLQNNQS
ncbi:MAG TPA: 16S rRNA (cytosine(967)-C(5))-methyltransferase RsmB [Firmicutes bacterium]|nr:16S rRNA (cytosine(967)-C(5))-methyltransferase RsmB [Bacillota bacterium]